MLSEDIAKDIARIDGELDTARGAGEWLQVAAHEAQLAKLRKDLADARVLERDAAQDLRDQQRADARKAALRQFDTDVAALDAAYGDLCQKFDRSAEDLAGMWQEFHQLHADATALQGRARALGLGIIGADRLRVGAALTGALLDAKRGEGPLRWLKG